MGENRSHLHIPFNRYLALFFSKGETEKRKEEETAFPPDPKILGCHSSKKIYCEKYMGNGRIDPSFLVLLHTLSIDI